jgi:predicted RNase H-like HicB family nuclease/uncharacterized damage-inducible protein DinB
MNDNRRTFFVNDGRRTLRLTACEEGGFAVTSPSDPRLITQGESLTEAFANAEDAASLLAEADAVSLTQSQWMLATIRSFLDHRVLAERTIDQIDDAALHRRPAEGFNSIAIIMRHIAGNFRSRFTDFLTTDGEKPTRDRDREFEDWPSTRDELLDEWEAGRSVLFLTLQQLRPADELRTVTIRGEAHTVPQAIERALAHLAYHVGQIVLLARLFNGDKDWNWLTIPPGQSRKHNESTWDKAASRGMPG